ncbi:TPA: relaxase/mobilization nuclease domain-containing protein [Pasteurella multocida]|nr:relaxase/mobilization nuclease domain-containing protein [Pasteurella multocida]
MVQLHYDKEDLWLIAKRGKGAKIVKSRTGKNNVVYSKIKAKTNPYSNHKNNKHVLVKITGGAKTSERAKEHFNYITRNGDLLLYDDKGDLIDLKIAQEEVREIIDNDLRHLRKDANRTYQIAFSRSGKTDPTLLKQVVFETVRQQFPDNKFYYTAHEDTNNTHIHVVIERKGKNRNKILRVDKSKLNEVKKSFSEIQNKYGLEAVFLSETDRKKQRGEQVEKSKREDKRKGANEYIVLDFDKAPYEFKENGKPSFYLCVETKNGEKKLHWSWGLQKEIKEKGVKLGDKITLKKIKSLDFDQINENGKFKKSDWKIEILEKTQDIGIEKLKVIDFGNAPYKFDSMGKPSYYVILQDDKGLNRDVWGLAIEKQIMKMGINIGDSILLDKSNPKQLLKQEAVTQGNAKPLDKIIKDRDCFKV